MSIDLLLDLVDTAIEEFLFLEWIGRFTWPNGESRGQCLRCYATQNEVEHTRACSLDAFLTAAGFPDQASRDAERARRATRKCEKESR